MTRLVQDAAEVLDARIEEENLDGMSEAAGEYRLAEGACTWGTPILCLGSEA
jgi:hypothetical protein